MCSRANLLIPGCGEGKYSAYCRPSDKAVGDRPQIHSHLVFEWGWFYFLRGRTKSLKLIIVMWHLILVLGVRTAFVYDSVARWFRAWKWSCSVVSDPLWPLDCGYQASRSIGFSRQEYWSELPFPSPRDLPDPGIEPGSPDGLQSEPPGKWSSVSSLCTGEIT